MKISVLCQSGLTNFIEPVVKKINEDKDFQMEICDFGKLSNSVEYFKDVDIVWFEWGNQIAIDFLSSPFFWPIIQNKKIVMRLHSYEAFDFGFLGKIPFEKIDKVFFVADHILEYAIDRLTKKSNNSYFASFLEDRFKVVPNGVDVEKFNLNSRKNWKANGKDIAYLGYLNHKKGPMLLLHAFKYLQYRDPKLRLHIAGTFQDERYRLYFQQMMREMRLEDNIIFYSWVNTPEKFLADKDYIISTSLLEGHPVGILEAMAMGLKPLIHNFYGARSCFPRKYLWNDFEKLYNLVLEDSYPLDYAGFVLGSYTLEQQAEKFKVELRGVT